MSRIIDKANEAVGMMHAEGIPEAKAFDPLTLLLVVEALVTIGKALHDCYAENHKQAAATVNSPNLIRRWQARRMIRQAFRGEGWNTHREQACDALFRLGATATEDDVKKLVEEARGRAPSL